MSETVTDNRIPVTRVTIGFSEAEGRDCHISGRGFESLELFDAAIAQIKPPSLGYYKTDFTIEFQDGQTYQGRYDIGSDKPTLRDHVRGFCETYSGRVKPKHMTDEHWKRFCSSLDDPRWGEFLDLYAI